MSGCGALTQTVSAILPAFAQLAFGMTIRLIHEAADDDYGNECHDEDRPKGAKEFHAPKPMTKYFPLQSL
jgi:hypothetical protein